MMMIEAKFSLLLFTYLFINNFIDIGYGWDNGLALRPPMGWLSWMKYTCEIDCKQYPNDCINEKLYKDMIDHLANDGYLKAGYRYVNIDDCWSERDRNWKTKRLVPDHQRFPSGIKKLADYAHSKNVLLGIYEDVGDKTCEGYPGTYSDNFDHTFIDAETFSEWTVDSLKLDGCYADIKNYNYTYPRYRQALEQVTQPIIYSCSWPAYMKYVSDKTYEQIRENCNLWRNFNDIIDSYQSVLSIINFYAKNNEQFIRYHGPGGWFDPDMLIIGNNGLSYEQSETQMAFWCMWSAPLYMSNDLRTISKEMKEILLNKELIAIDQDPLGIMASLVYNNKNMQQQVWTKKLSPINDINPWAILYFNGAQLGPDTYMSFQLSWLIPELNRTISYDIYDLYETNSNRSYIGAFKGEQFLKLLVPTAGSVRIVKLIPNF